MQNIIQKKLIQRKNALKKRAVVFQKNSNISNKLYENLFNSKIYKNAKIVGSYYSIRSEIETRNLNSKIIESGKKICLPVMNYKNKTLIFRELNLNTKLIKKKFSIMEPSIKSPKVIPDLLLVPCVAFDILGYRLGYGGGFYDRTINRIKKIKPKLETVIVAFSKQKLKKIIVEDFDAKLSYILTEKYLFKI